MRVAAHGIAAALIVLIAACSTVQETTTVGSQAPATASPALGTLAGHPELALYDLADRMTKYSDDPLSGFTYMLDWADSELAWVESVPAAACLAEERDDYRIAVKGFNELIETARDGLRRGDLLAAELVQKQQKAVLDRLKVAGIAFSSAARDC